MFKVLIVDDEPLVLEGLKTMIDWEKYGFTVSAEASDGEDALEIIKVMNPHLVITDIRMPVIDGLCLIEKAKENRNIRTKFVILSGYDDFTYAKKAMYHNVNHYLLKPIDTDEIEGLLEKIEKELQVEMRSQETQDKTIAFITENTIHRVINGENKESLINKAEFLLEIDQNTKVYYGLVEIDHFDEWMNNFDEDEIKNKKEQIRKNIEELFAKMGISLVYIYEDDLDRFGIILSAQLEENMVKDLTVIRSEIMEQYEVGISIFVSGWGKGVVSLPDLYRQAIATKNYGFLDRMNNIFFYEQMKETYMNYELYEEDIEEILKEIEKNNEKNIRRSIDIIFQKLYENKSEVSIIEACLTNLKAEIIKKIYELNGNAYEFAKWILQYEVNIIKMNFMETKELVTNLCLKSAEYIADLQKKDSGNLIYELEKCIAQNYTKQLKLQDLADQFYMNPVYLGQLFKKKTNMFFNEYLHHVRVEEAKKLLQRTEMKISDIALSVGYKDTEYFTNKFKMITKTVPSMYKQNEVGDIM